MLDSGVFEGKRSGARWREPCEGAGTSEAGCGTVRDGDTLRSANLDRVRRTKGVQSDHSKKYA